MLDTLARVLAAKGSCNEALTTFRAAIDAVPPTRTKVACGKSRSKGVTTLSTLIAAAKSQIGHKATRDAPRSWKPGARRRA